MLGIVRDHIIKSAPADICTCMFYTINLLLRQIKRPQAKIIISSFRTRGDYFVITLLAKSLSAYCSGDFPTLWSVREHRDVTGRTMRWKEWQVCIRWAEQNTWRLVTEDLYGEKKKALRGAQYSAVFSRFPHQADLSISFTWHFPTFIHFK